MDGRLIQVHVAVRSFGGVEDGPATIVDGVLAAGSTVLAATMAPDLFGMPAPLDDRPARNGVDYARQPAAQAGPVYDDSCVEVSAWLGAFSAHVAARPDRVRCRYASGEFSAVGPTGRAVDRGRDAGRRVRAAASAGRAGRRRHLDGRRPDQDDAAA